MATLRQNQKAMTRQLLLDAALELFQQQGYAATTIDEIATAAGTTRVTFYAHFPSRTDLMRALIDEKLNEALQRVRSPDHGSTELELVAVVREGTREAIGAWLSARANRWPDVVPILRAAREAAAVDRELTSLVDVWMEEAIADIDEALTQADRFEPHSRHYRGVLAMAQLDYTAQHWPEPAWHIDRNQMLETLTDSWTQLLGGEPQL
jgi:AcrR family transcriptional regulator